MSSEPCYCGDTACPWCGTGQADDDVNDALGAIAEAESARNANILALLAAAQAECKRLTAQDLADLAEQATWGTPIVSRETLASLIALARRAVQGAGAPATDGEVSSVAGWAYRTVEDGDADSDVTILAARVEAIVHRLTSAEAALALAAPVVAAALAQLDAACAGAFPLCGDEGWIGATTNTEFAASAYRAAQPEPAPAEEAQR